MATSTSLVGSSSKQSNGSYRESGSTNDENSKQHQQQAALMEDCDEQLSNSSSPTSTSSSDIMTGLACGPSSMSPSTSPSSTTICGWCQKEGLKLFTLRTSDGSKTRNFCSEFCFTQCRRASFKKNKICHWCKHVRHTVNYVDFHDGKNQLQFCSTKCLNQYKMNVVCREIEMIPRHLLNPFGGMATSTSLATSPQPPIGGPSSPNHNIPVDLCVKKALSSPKGDTVPAEDKRICSSSSQPIVRKGSLSSSIERLALPRKRKSHSRSCAPDHQVRVGGVRYPAGKDAEETDKNDTRSILGFNEVKPGVQLPYPSLSDILRQLGPHHPMLEWIIRQQHGQRIAAIPPFLPPVGSRPPPVLSHPLPPPRIASSSSPSSSSFQTTSTRSVRQHSSFLSSQGSSLASPPFSRQAPLVAGVAATSISSSSSLAKKSKKEDVDERSGSTGLSLCTESSKTCRERNGGDEQNSRSRSEESARTSHNQGNGRGKSSSVSCIIQSPLTPAVDMTSSSSGDDLAGVHHHHPVCGSVSHPPSMILPIPLVLPLPIPVPLPLFLLQEKVIQKIDQIAMSLKEQHQLKEENNNDQSSRT